MSERGWVWGKRGGAQGRGSLRARARGWAWGLLALALVGCPPGQPDATQVVVYVALDRLYAQPILEAFTAKTGIEVLPKWDTEATKTTGLVTTLRSEAARPRCDVFWNNEVSQTIGLASDGLLEPYESPAAADLPGWARPTPRTWTGFAARARVLIVNTDLVPAAERPDSVEALADPRWKGRCAIAKPLFGTTATHVAALFAWDEARGKDWLARIKANDVVVCAGNADVKDRVAQGELAFGLTDTDDANLALLAGQPVAVVFPDQGDDQPGTLLIPNAVSILKGAPHPEAARRLVDYLLSPAVEEQLAQARSVQVPLRAGLARADWIPGDIQTLPVTWEDVGARFEDARDHVQREFLDD